MFGQPCVGCGHCCSLSICAFGQCDGVEYDDVPCPRLRYDGERHWCEVVEKAEGADLEDIRDGLAIEEGCCSGLNSWRSEIIDRTK